MFIFIIATLIYIATSIAIIKIDTLPAKWKITAQATTLILTATIGSIVLIAMIWTVFSS